MVAIGCEGSMDLPSLIKTIPQLKDVAIATLSWETIDGGWSNHNYLLIVNGKKFVLREPVASNEEGINREAELFNTQHAANAGLCYPFIYFDANSGISLREYVEGHPPTDENETITPHTLQEIAATLKCLHALPAHFFNATNHFLLIEKTIQYIQRYAPNSLDEYAHLLAESSKVKKYIDTHAVQSVPCHNDPNPRNFLFTQNKVFLLDWEYSGNGDPAWDIAYFIAHGNLDETSEKKFLNHYFSSGILANDYDRIVVYKPITLLIFALWIRLQRVKKHWPVTENELIYWEETLHQEIAAYFASEQHQKVIRFLEGI